jgi:hypothetical protein
MDFDRYFRVKCDRLFQSPFAYEAPWTDHIGNDINANGLLTGHGELLLGAA